ncbi:MAG: transporter [Candidatus Caenarcaniphilales bacterium]|jgi:hypothetical protein|nr:transporter [Candidatus Caenarcaniphilales bacterium]
MPFIVLLFLLLSKFNPVAAHGGSCACTAFRYAGIGGPIITLPAYTMKQGSTSLSFGLNYLDSSRLSTSSTRTVLNSKNHADDNSGSISPSIGLAYGLTDEINIFASLPYNINIGFREISGDGIEDQGNSIGFGDLSLLGQYKFLDTNKFQAALIGGIKIPSGQDDVMADNNEKFEAKNQPGSGSFDPLFGFALSKQYDGFGLDFNFLYKLTTEGSQNTDIGDSANYSFAISRAINHSHQDPFVHSHNEGSKATNVIEKIFPEHIAGQHLTWDLVLEAITHWEAKPEIDGVADANHGGTTVSLHPGLRMTINEELVTNLSLGFPVVEDLNGEQGGRNFQLLFNVGVLL